MSRTTFFILFIVLLISCDNTDITKKNIKIIENNNDLEINTDSNQLVFRKYNDKYIAIFPKSYVRFKEQKIDFLNGLILYYKASQLNKINKIEEKFLNFDIETKLYPEVVSSGEVAFHSIKIPKNFFNENTFRIFYKIKNIDNEEQRDIPCYVEKQFTRNDYDYYLMMIPINAYFDVLSYTINIEFKKNNDTVLQYSKEYEVKPFEKIFVAIRFKKEKAEEIARFDRTKYQLEKKDREVIYKSVEKKNFPEEFVLPLKNLAITNRFGLFRNWMSGNKVILRDIHDGVDLNATFDEPVYASNDGVVRYAREVELIGKVVIINHGNGICTEYFHLNTINVKEGDIVKKMDKIGTAGMSGSATGTHLHWGLRINGVAVDPIKFINFNIRGLLEKF